VRQTGRNT